jgi:hypothetical protein
MPRTFAAAVLLAALALLPPGKAVAGPPDGASGKMVLDEVADGLRKYRKEEDLDRRFKALNRLAPTRDPRVAVALGEAFDEEDKGYFRFRLSICLDEWFVPPDFRPKADCIEVVRRWWDANEADLRRRAAQLPR